MSLFDGWSYLALLEILLEHLITVVELQDRLKAFSGMNCLKDFGLVISLSVIKKSALA